MKTSCRSLLLLMGLSMFLLISGEDCIAWDETTHRGLTASAADFSVLHESKGDYLKYIGIEEGLHHKLNWHKRKKVKGWLEEGAAYEDDNPRFNNHFHNPLVAWGSAGLDDWCLLVHVSGESALLWAQDDDMQENTSEGDWSWRTIRDHYYDALTASTDAERQSSFARTFKGLGHQMHLVQDMAVPAHVRNDAHPLDAFVHKNRYGGLFFESWAGKNNSIVNALARNASRPAFGLRTRVPYGGSALAPITELTDRNVYNGSNPPGIHSLSAGLGEYTNANFFSDDTLFAAENSQPGQNHYFPYPRKEDTNIQAFIDQELLPETDSQSDDTTFHISKVTENNEKEIEHFVQPTYFTEYLTPPFPLYFRSYYLSERCHEDAAAFLVPRAVGYSTRILDYFFRGDMDLKMDEENSASWKIENRSSEAMDGCFEIYYDNKTGKRKKLWESDLSIAPGERSDQEVDFDVPEDAREPGKYMLVFRGSLGCEDHAVAGVVCYRKTLCQYIQEKWLLSVLYNGKERIVEPYLLFETKKGNRVLHSWQTEGEYDDTPPPDWCNMSLSGISRVVPLNDHFDKPHPDYNPGSPLFHRVICCTE